MDGAGGRSGEGEGGGSAGLDGLRIRKDLY